MPQEIIDLDASGVIAEPKQVKLHGVIYKLPGDVPAPLYVQLMGAADRGDDPQLSIDVYGEILELFRVYQPTLERLPLGLNEMTAAVGAIYRGQAEDGTVGGGDEEGPTKPRASTRKKASSRSRSST